MVRTYLVCVVRLNAPIAYLSICLLCIFGLLRALVKSSVMSGSMHDLSQPSPGISNVSSFTNAHLFAAGGNLTLLERERERVSYKLEKMMSDRLRSDFYWDLFMITCVLRIFIKFCECFLAFSVMQTIYFRSN